MAHGDSRRSFMRCRSTPPVGNYNETRTHLALDKDAPLSRTVKRAGGYSLPTNPRRIASRICPDLISGRHRYRGVGVLPFWLLVVGAIAVLDTPRPTIGQS